MAKIARCRVCECTESDCFQCVEATGDACCWVESDLCSACVALEAAAATMFSSKLMDQLESVLEKLVHERGAYREKAAEIRRELDERGVLSDFEEFLSWFPEETADVGGSD